MWRLTEYQGKLIVGTMDAFFGCELWASETGDLGTFEQINLNGMDLSYTLPANLGAFFGTDFIVPIADQYGVRSFAEYQGYLMVGTASWGAWVDKMLYAATNGSWHNLSENVGCEVWRTNGNTYIPLNIGVNKTVLDPDTGYWVKELNANKSDTVTFRYELRNNGISNLSNITVRDFLSSSLNYSNNATLDNGTATIDREPDLVEPLTKDGCPIGTMLVWNLTDVVLEPGDRITVEYNASVVVDCGADINFLSVTGEFEKYPEAECGYGWDFAIVNVLCDPPQEIEVTKMVQGPAAGYWVEDEFTASKGDTVRFKYELKNMGTYNLTNITVWDFLSSSLNYSNNATLDNGTATIDREPDLVEALVKDSHTLGTMLVWNLTGDVIEPGRNITIEYNASVVKRGVDINFLSATGEFEQIEACTAGWDYVIVRVPPKKIEVTKTVLVDPINDTWGKRLDASMGDTVRFKYELYNPEGYDLSDITGWDFLSPSLEYADNATQDPYPVVPLTMGNHTLGTLLVWNFTDVVLEPYGNITIEYNTSIVQCGEDINFLFGVGLFKDTEEHSFGCDFAMVQVPCPSGDATDSVGGVQEEYNTGETVYATGSGFAPNTLVDIYIVNDYGLSFK